jgi:hypothetical protein
MIRGLTREVMAACSSRLFTNRSKIELRELLFFAIESYGSPEVELPDWMYETPPRPTNSKGALSSRSEEFLNQRERAIGGNKDGGGCFQDENARTDESARLWWGNSKPNLSQDKKSERRRLYLQLMMRTHPDRARSEEDRARRTVLASRITNAYSNAQYSVLLEIQSILDSEAERELAVERFSYFNDHILEMETQRRLLEDELKRTKHELSALKRSAAGKAHTYIADISAKIGDAESALVEFRSQVKIYRQTAELIQNVLSETLVPALFARWFRNNCLVQIEADHIAAIYQEQLLEPEEEIEPIFSEYRRPRRCRRRRR